MGSIRMCRREGYGFHAVKSGMNRVQNSESLGLEQGIFFQILPVIQARIPITQQFLGSRIPSYRQRMGATFKVRDGDNTQYTLSFCSPEKITRSRRRLKSFGRTIHMKPLQNFLVLLARSRRSDRGTARRDLSRKNSEGWTHSTL